MANSSGKDWTGATFADLKAWIADNDFPDDATVMVWSNKEDNGEGELHVNGSAFHVDFACLD